MGSWVFVWHPEERLRLSQQLVVCSQGPVRPERVMQAREGGGGVRLSCCWTCTPSTMAMPQLHASGALPGMQRGTGRTGRALAAAQVMADHAAHEHVQHDDGRP